MLQCPLQVAPIERFRSRHDRQGEDALAALGQTPMIRCRATPSMDCPDLPSGKDGARLRDRSKDSETNCDDQSRDETKAR